MMRRIVAVLEHQHQNRRHRLTSLAGLIFLTSGDGEGQNVVAQVVDDILVQRGWQHGNGRCAHVGQVVDEIFVKER